MTLYSVMRTPKHYDLDHGADYRKLLTSRRGDHYLMYDCHMSLACTLCLISDLLCHYHDRISAPALRLWYPQKRPAQPSPLTGPE